MPCGCEFGFRAPQPPPRFFNDMNAFAKPKYMESSLPLNKLCEIEDWALPGMAETMCRLMPDLAQTLPRYPFGYEHRKVWEYAHVLLGLDRIGALEPDAFVLSI